MTDTTGIPEDVLRFLTDRIDSVPHLEVLLLLWRNSDQRWTEEEIASHVYVDLEMARRVLRDLHRQGMVIIESSGTSARYGYQPAWDEAKIMRKVVATYAQDLIRVATFIHSKASPGVREFTRAFKLKRD